MKELRDIIRAYDAATSQNKKTAIATVVRVDGSSYRRPGARMLVTDDGKITGAISGGCLEGDALEKARFAIASGQNKLVSYDSTDEEDIQFGLHLGCNGIVHILFEPIIKEDPHNPVELLRRMADSGREAVLITLFSLQDFQPGTRILFLKNITYESGYEKLSHLFLKSAAAALEQEQSAFIDLPIGHTPCTALVEYIAAPVSVVIAGAGNDIQPLTEMMAMMGWKVTIADGRYHYALPQRFPTANVIYSKATDILSKLTTDTRTVFLLMSHNYNYDLAFLTQIVQQEFGYIGLLGPAQKRDRMLLALQDQGIILQEDQLSKIHGPAGLDIGAEDSTEIALSIVAEIKAFLSGRPGSSLKLKKEAIHNRLADHLQHE